MATPTLPLPAARLRLRSHNAKSAKDRHDAAFLALEVSVKLAVAAAPPGELAPLRRGTLGHWVSACRPHEQPLDDSGLLALHGLLTEVGTGKRAAPQRVRGRQLLDALPAYRNRVVGHGSVRASSFYEEAAEVLLAGLDAAWRNSLFLSGQRPMRFVDRVEVSSDGARRGWVLDLDGELPRVLDRAGTDVPEDVRPERVYLREGDAWRSLHPWVLFDPETDAAFCFNGLGRAAQFLDYATGVVLAGAALEERFPGAAATVAELFRDTTEAPPPAEEREEEPEGESGARFGGFELLGELGQGAMGVVHLARQRSLGRRVALKLLPAHKLADEVAVRRFQREVRTLSLCEHPSVVKILDAGEVRGVPYFAMELVEGVDLRGVAAELRDGGDLGPAVARAWEAERRARAGALGETGAKSTHEPHDTERDGGDSAPGGAALPADRWRALARYFRDAALGLEHLHERGIVHRDISPGNLMATAREARAVVMDFGLAAVPGVTGTQTQSDRGPLGTLRYVAPEQLRTDRARADARADVYALGAVMFELLAGRPMHDGDSEARIVDQVLHEDAPPLEKMAPGCPRDLALIARKATEKELAFRYESAHELASDLDAWLEGRPISARPPSLGYQVRLLVRRNRAQVATAATALVVLLAVMAGFLVTLARKNVALQELADFAKPDYLTARADELWPPAPELIDDYETWLADRDDLGSRIDDYSARSATSDLTGSELRVLHDFLEGVERLDVPGGPCESIRRRLTFAAEVEERSLTGSGAKARWAVAIAEIGAPGSPYDGLELEPVLGLLPLGPDPRSGLQEFAHLFTGEPAARDDQGELVFTEETGIVLVLIPGGTFRMGAQSTDSSAPGFDRNAMAAEAPPHEVALDPYFLSKYELSQGQWLRCTGENPSSLQPGTSDWPGSKEVSDLRHPVELVSWEDCTLVLGRIGLQLPTEAQWERAARAGTEGFVWIEGSVESAVGMVPAIEGKVNLADATVVEAGESWPQVEAWHRDGWLRHAPVNAFTPNPFGLHSTCGNVWEWCRDERVSYEARPRGGDGYRGRGGGIERVGRGGGYSNNLAFARSAIRDSRPTIYVQPSYGVRPALSLGTAPVRR